MTTAIAILAGLFVLAFGTAAYGVARARANTRRLDELGAVEATIPTEARAAARGTAAHELEQREKVHALSNRVVGLEERIDRVRDRVAEIELELQMPVKTLEMPSDAATTGEHPTIKEPFP